MTSLASPHSLEQAIRVLAREPDLRPIAGCTDLMVCDPLHRLRLDGVLDLLSIPELKGIHELEDAVEIGATTTFSEIGRSRLISEKFPALAAAARVVGGWQIQNRATIGGNVVNASPAGDSLPVLLALDARAIVAGSGGEREIPFSSFYLGYRETALRSGELLARLRVPFSPDGTRQYFRKVGTREAQAISKVVVATAGRVEDGTIAALRIGAGSVAATPVRLYTVEETLIGGPAVPETADLAERVAVESVEPIDDVRSTAAYRRFALGRIVRRMMLDLIANGP
jgi:CO/xanthine dehydrogenase FAD-binding subunit